MSYRYEEPFYMTKESIINFENDCTVAYRGQVGRLDHMDKKMCFICFENGEASYIRYSELTIVSYKPAEKPVKLSYTDKSYIIRNMDMTSKDIAHIISKPVSQVEKFKLKIKG